MVLLKMRTKCTHGTCSAHESIWRNMHPVVRLIASRKFYFGNYPANFRRTLLNFHVKNRNIVSFGSMHCGAYERTNERTIERSRLVLDPLRNYSLLTCRLPFINEFSSFSLRLLAGFVHSAFCAFDHAWKTTSKWDKIFENFVSTA